MFTLAPYLENVDEIRICPDDPQGDERLALRGTSYVVNDYIHNKVIRRGAHLAAVVGCVILITVGGAALISTSPETTNKLLNNTSQVVPAAK